MRSKGVWVGQALLLALVSCVLLCAPLFTASGCFQGAVDSDLAKLNIPMRWWMGDCWRHGQVPWWNPYMFTGYPCWAFRAPWAGGLLFWTLCRDPAWALRWELFSHLLWMHLGLQVWLRARGHSLVAGGLGAHLVTFSGFTLYHIFAGHLELLDSLAWTGWALWGFESFLLSGSRKNLAKALVPISLLVLNGHFQIAYLVLWCAVLWNGARALGREIPVSVSTVLLRVLVMALGSGLLCAFQLWPLAQSLKWFNRSNTGAKFLSSSGEPISAWLTWWVPDVFFLKSLPFAWTFSSFWESHAYMSAFAPVLLFALCGARQRKGTLFFLAFTVLLSFGMTTPLFWLVRQLDPILAMFRVPSRFILPASLVVAELVASAWDRPQIGRGVMAARIWMAALFLGAGLLWLMGPAGLFKGCVDLFSSGKALVYFREQRFPDSLEVVWRATLVRLLFQALLLALVAAALAWRQRSRKGAALLLLGLGLLDAGRLAYPCWRQSGPLSPVPPQWIEQLSSDPVPYRGLMDLDLPWTCWGPSHSIYQFDGYEISILQSWTRAVAVVLSGGKEETAFLYNLFDDHPLFDHFSVRYFLTSRPEAELPPALRGLPVIGQTQGQRILENPRAQSRFSFVYRLISEGTEEPADVWRRLLAQPEFARGSVASWEGPERVWPAVHGEVRAARLEPNTVDVLVSVEGRCILRLNDAFTPGWTVTVDGTPQPLLSLDAGLGRGVELSPGEHRVHMHFLPAGFWPGAAVSALGVVVLCLLSLWPRPRRD